MKILLVIVASFLLAGNAFAGDAPVSPETWNTYQGTTLTVVTHRPTDFTAMTVARAELGIAGAFLEIGKGNQLVHDDQIVDPALALAARLSTDLSSRLKPANVTTLPDQVSLSDKTLAGVAGNKGLVLDVESSVWGYLYYTMHWGRYRAQYIARVRLLDAATGELVAKTRCWIDPDATTSSPTGDEMLANNGEKLKAMLAADGNDCLASVEKDLFGAAEPAPAAPVVPAPVATPAVTPPTAPAPNAAPSGNTLPPKTN
jgi:hypothetical protein